MSNKLFKTIIYLFVIGLAEAICWLMNGFLLDYVIRWFGKYGYPESSIIADISLAGIIPLACSFLIIRFVYWLAMTRANGGLQILGGQEKAIASIAKKDSSPQVVHQTQTAAVLIQGPNAIRISGPNAVHLGPGAIKIEQHVTSYHK